MCIIQRGKDTDDSSTRITSHLSVSSSCQRPRARALAIGVTTVSFLLNHPLFSEPSSTSDHVPLSTLSISIPGGPWLHPPLRTLKNPISAILTTLVDAAIACWTTPCLSHRDQRVVGLSPSCKTLTRGWTLKGGRQMPGKIIEDHLHLDRLSTD